MAQRQQVAVEPRGSGVLASPAMHRFTAPVALLPALLALACGSGEGSSPPSRLDADESIRLERAMATLETASRRVRAEVLRTCDKWHHLDRPCVENEIRREQLDCWLTDGLRRWKGAQKRGLGPFSGDRVTMRVQNLCVERRRWRKIEKSPF